MIKVGRRLYYDKITGFVILEVNEQIHYFERAVQGIEKDVKDFKVLSERNRDTFDVLELPYGAYAQDFQSANCIVDVKAKKPTFVYFDKPAVAPTPPLSDSLQALADENAELLMQNAMQDVSITSLQDENADLMMRIALLEMGGSTNV